MKTLIWKEMRENAKWFALSGAVVSVAFFIGSLPSDEPDNPAHFLQKDFQKIHIFVAGMVGLLIGLCQGLAERDRDQLAFLIHRPVTRQRIFLSKVFAGLLGYGLALGIPYLGTVLWFCQAGVSPFEFETAMLLPGAVDTLAGCLAYFAALLVGFRQARWFGSRAMPLVAAALLMIGMALARELWEAIALWGIGLVFLAGGACLVFDADGDDGRVNERWRVLLTATLVPAIIALQFLLVGIALNVVMDDEQKWEAYWVDTEGEIYRTEYTRSGTTQVFNLDGEELTKSRNGTWRTTDELQRYDLPLAGIGVPPRRDYGRSVLDSYRSMAPYYYVLDRVGDKLWFYSASKQKLLIYDLVDRDIVGAFGSNGFFEEVESSNPFQQVKPWNVTYIGVDRTLIPDLATNYAINVKDLSLEPVVLPVPDERDFDTRVFRTSSGRRDGRDENWHLVVSQTNGLTFFSRETKKEFTLPFGRKPPEWVYFAFLQKRQEWIVTTPMRPAHTPGFVRRYQLDGTLVSERELPALRDRTLERPHEGSVLAGLNAPPSLWLWIEAEEYLVGSKFPESEVLAKREIHRQKWYLRCLAIQVLAAVFLALVLVRARFLRSQDKIMIGMACVLIGPGGVIAMALVRGRTVMEDCHACGVRRLVDEAKCPACDSAFAPSATDGTEIFAELKPAESRSSL